MNKVQNRKLIPLAAIILSVILAITTLWSLSFFNATAFAADNTSYVPFPNTAIKLENSNFEDSSGEYPKTPASWTGAAIGDNKVSTALGGVINVDEYAKHKDAIKLDELYPQDGFDRAPQTPFNETDYPGVGSNILMVNVPNAKTAYGYSSAALTFEPNRFYSISAWVRTGNFLDDSGAAIRLTGLDESVAFNNINTVKDYKTAGAFDPTLLTEANKYGWQKYAFYIASSSTTPKTVSISLQVGDAYKSETAPQDNFNYPASGYAFFDNIEVYEISPSTFYKNKQTATSGGSVMVKDFSDISNYLDSSLTTNKYEDANWNFTHNTNDWSTVFAQGTDLKDLQYGIYDAYNEFDDKAENDYNLKKDPSSSLGQFKPDSKILVLSSYAGAKEYASVAAGIRSKDISIERYKYYRISAWVKAIDVTGGSGATMILNANRGVSKDSNLNAKISNCTGDEANKSRNGYKQYSFYVKGSSLQDYSVNLDLMLGSKGSESKGIALFDNVSVQNITPKQFADNSASGTVVNMDTDNGVDGNPFVTFTDTGIANGKFYFAGDYTDYKFPLPASDWTKYDVTTVGTTGYSTDTSFIESDAIISGIMPTNKEHFAANSKNYGKNVYNPRPGAGSMLLMASEKQTAFCYRSPNFSVTAKKAEDTDVKIGKLTVDMFVDNITGYGANLVLKSGTNVISTIENIQNTSTTSAASYTFYVEPGKVDVADLSVEIWLGLNDRTNNQTKLSSGNIYVQQVSFAMVTDSYVTAQTAYNTARQNNSKIITAAYSFANEDFGAYDYYDTSFVKHPYNYTLSVKGDASNVTYGLFNPKNGLGNQTIIPSTFKNSDDAKFSNVLVLKNSAPAASTLSLNTKFALEADKYYKLSVRLKVDITNTDGAGAGVKLSGSDFMFKNIKSTSETPDQITYNEVFKTFTFYIKCGATATSVGVDITLGDSSNVNNYSSGIVYVNDINFTDITNSLFDESTTDAKLKDNAYDIKAVLSETPETPEEEAPKTPIQWWLIPSILFAVAILIAIVGFSVRRIIERRKQNRPINNSNKSASYDRDNTLNIDYNNKTTDDTQKLTTSPTDDKTYDKFNDDATQAVEVKESDITTVIEPQEQPVTAPTDNATEAQEQPKQEQTEQPKPNDFNDQFDD